MCVCVVCECVLCGVCAVCEVCVVCVLCVCVCAVRSLMHVVDRALCLCGVCVCSPGGRAGAAGGAPRALRGFRLGERARAWPRGPLRRGRERRPGSRDPRRRRRDVEGGPGTGGSLGRPGAEGTRKRGVSAA